MGHRTGRAVIVTVVCALVVGASGLVYAHGGDTSEIHSCVKPGTGQLRVIDADGTCKPDETALDWGAEGVPGPAGGLAGYVRVTAVMRLEPGEAKSGAAICPPGKVVLGGGFDSAEIATVTNAFPRDDRFAVGARNDGTVADNVGIHATCAIAE